MGFGGAPLGDLYAVLDDQVAIDAVSAAIAADITLFDTSPFYGHGLSEHRMGTALRRATRPTIVSTKVGRVMTGVRGSAGQGERFAGDESGCDERTLLLIHAQPIR